MESHNSLLTAQPSSCGSGVIIIRTFLQSADFFLITRLTDTLTALFPWVVIQLDSLRSENKTKLQIYILCAW